MIISTIEIVIHITGKTFLNVQKNEYNLMKNLSISTIDGKNISDSRNLIFTFVGNKEKEYEKVKHAIIIFLFFKNIYFVYVDKEVVNNDYNIHKNYSTKLIDNTLSSTKNDEDKIIRKDNRIYYGITAIAKLKIEINLDITIKLNIGENEFLNIYTKINNNITRYLHLIEFFNYISISSNEINKFLILIIIIEAISNYNSNNNNALKKIESYFDYLHNHNIYNFAHDIKSYASTLYDIRSSIAHYGDLNNIRKKSTENFLKKYDLKQIIDEVFILVRTILRYEIKKNL